MEIVDRLHHRKGREAPLPMHLLHKVETGLKFGLKPLKGLKLLLGCCWHAYHDDLLSDVPGWVLGSLSSVDEQEGFPSCSGLDLSLWEETCILLHSLYPVSHR